MRHLYITAALAIFAAATELLASPPGDPAAHWAFQPVANPAPPSAGENAWPKGDIDHFILARMKAAGLAPSPEADRRSIIRRLCFDLLGLPPTFDEVRTFEGDADPRAYTKLVDRLLASPHFGERWARHWLDVARYADTKGYTFKESREYPYAYTYRDWTIRAFNDDIPYDEFLLYQIAADRAIAPGGDRSDLAAMGFLTVGRRFLNRKHDIIDDRIDVTFRGAMALTVACSRCHDHKHDPIPTADYYSLYGVFDSSIEPPELPLLPDAPSNAYTEAFEKGFLAKQKKLDDYLASRSAELKSPAFLARYLLAAHEFRDLDAGELKKAASDRKLLQSATASWRDYLKRSQASQDPVFSIWHRLAAIPTDGDFTLLAAEEIARLEAEGAKLDPRFLEIYRASPPPHSLAELAAIYATAFASPGATPALAAVLAAEDSPANIPPDKIYAALETKGQQHFVRLRKERDDFRASHPGAPPRAMVMNDLPKPRQPHVFDRGDPARRGAKVPRQFLTMLSDGSPAAYTDGSGRLEMARDIVSPNNPLTARVWANRVWGHLLGRHLVDTPSDFGLRSDPPSHPLLLDHLATRLVEGGWSTKSLIRSIVLSATYRQTSLAPSGRDPENRHFARAIRKRAGFEAFRDGILTVTGQLDRKQFGRPVDIAGDSYSTRRTVYGKIARQNLPPVFRTFDFASPDVHIPKRAETTVPQQALYMLNGKFAADAAARLIANPGRSGAMKDEDRIRWLYRKVFAREPVADEISDGLAFVRHKPGQGRYGAWDYGYGHFDSENSKVEFQSLPHFAVGTWRGGPKLPDPKLGWVSIGKQGGHPGDASHQAIWRWRAPSDAAFRIEGSVKRPAAQGDGVHAAVFVNGRKLESWTIPPAGERPTHIDSVPLKRGDTLHFIVAAGATINNDSFTWNPGIRDLQSGETWLASDGFRNEKPPKQTSLWEQYALALLSSNEFAFID